MKQLLKNTYVSGKRVIVRCDYNVPIKNGYVMDETRIINSLETINYLLKQNCSIIILSHLGRIKSEEDKKNNSLIPIKNVLEKELNKNIKFASNILSPETKKMALSLAPGEILLMENTRFLDIPEKKESVLDEEVAKTIASYGEVFVLDAFSVSHRNHTTITGISKYLPNCLGFLTQKEITMLDTHLKTPNHPFTLVMGGAKVDDKLEIIKSLLPKCDHILLGGGLANSFLNVLGLSVGKSLKCEKYEINKELVNLMLTYKEKFALPLDAVTNNGLKNINSIKEEDIIKDIGPKTVNKYATIIASSNTIFLNGTMGVFEEAEFAAGTKNIFEALKNAKGDIVIGGGDTVSALNNLGYYNSFQNISTGGGATLEYIAKGNLCGIDAINNEDNIELL